MFKPQLYGEVNDKKILLIPNKKYKISYQGYRELITKKVRFLNYKINAMLVKKLEDGDSVWIYFEDIENIEEI